MSISHAVAPSNHSADGLARPTRDLFIPLPTSLDQPRYLRDPDPSLIEMYGSPGSVGPCLRGRWDWVHLLTGEVVSEACGANSCLACVRRKAHRTAQAIAVSRPEWWLTFTGVNNVWSDIQYAMRLLRTYLVRHGCYIQAVWAAEGNPRGTGAHVHGYAHSDAPTDLMAAAVKSAGFGHQFDWERARAGRGTRYMLKEVVHNEASLSAYRQRNGRHLVHVSRGFWRDEGGRTISGRQAVPPVTSGPPRPYADWLPIAKSRVRQGRGVR